LSLGPTGQTKKMCSFLNIPFLFILFGHYSSLPIRIIDSWGTDPDPGKWHGYLRIRIRNTDTDMHTSMKICLIFKCKHSRQFCTPLLRFLKINQV
jgi:hypothetical protein